MKHETVIDMDDLIYEKHMIEKEKAHEALCRRCGACCGVFEKAPCEHLVKKGSEYFCTIYENRFGIQKTTTGEKFKCVPIRNMLHKSWSGDWQCAYKCNIEML